jgi:hypothetical protein
MGAQFWVSQAEGFAGVLKTKNLAEARANSSEPFGTLYPADVNQNIPAYSHNTETGFFDGSSTDTSLPNDPPTAEFSAIRGLNTAGSASSGTRI